MAALGLVILGAGIISAAAVAWQLGEARARIAGEAQIVARAVTARGFALHHWLYQDADTAGRLGGGVPAEGEARVLTPAEGTALESHAASAPWHVAPRGWNIEDLVAMPAGQGGLALPHGVVVVTPPEADAADSAATSAALRTLREEVRNLLAAGLVDGRAAELAANAGIAFDPARQMAMFAASSAGLSPRAVLRFPRAGMEPPGILTDLDFAPGAGVIDGAGGALVRTRALETGRIGPRDAAEPVAFTQGLGITGEPGTELLRAAAVTVRSPVQVDGRLFAATVTQARLDGQETGTLACVRQDPNSPASPCARGDITVRGTLSGARRISACRPDGAGCNGGELDLSAGSGAPAWTGLAVFGLADLDTLTVTAPGATVGSGTGGVASGTAYTAEAGNAYAGGCTGC